jgi:DNA-binding Lrp family transcriptional regulator
MDALTAIFGNRAKVKILRLFLFNPETPFFLREISRRAQISPNAARKELGSLAEAGILKKRLIVKNIEIVRGKKTVAKKARGEGYILYGKFAYLEPLKNLLVISSVSADESLVKRFAGIGRLKFVMAAGVFIQNWDSRVDILLVGDGLSLRKIETVIRAIEADIGKEIAYSAFETQDFEYRLGIHDRLIRDILDYPHVTLLDRLGVEPR